MDVPANGPRRISFGLFEVDFSARKLYKRGLSVHVQDQSFQILAMLLERPGEIVTREDLQKRLWPSGTFVDFDDSLNTAMKKLRSALGDSFENPTFIETIHRHGYRFIAPLEVSGEMVTADNPGTGQRNAIGFAHFPGASRPERVMHFSITLPSGLRDLSLSRDGGMLAFVAPLSKQVGIRLWVQEVGSAGATFLENTEGASYPFWSPDGRSIGFFADGKLKRIGASGGPVQVICDAPTGRGASWNQNGVILFAPLQGAAICRVSSGGGPVELAPGFEQTLATTKCNRWPVFLPDGKHFIYTSVDFGADQQSDAHAIYLSSLDSKEHHRLVTSSSNAAYIAPGYLVFFRNGTLMAQRLDAQRSQLTGEAFAVANDVEYFSSVARALFSVSDNGTLVYQHGSGGPFSQFEWYDRDGKSGGRVGVPARYANPKISPDGKKVAAELDDPQSFNTDIWIFDLSQEVWSRSTFGSAQDQVPLWSSDGTELLWLSLREGKPRFYLKAASGLGIEKALTASTARELSFAAAPSDWSPDGHFLLYSDLDEDNALHLWVLPMAGDPEAYRLLSGVSADVQGQFSPDGRWVAYSSNESGRWQVYVAPFPGPGGNYQISIGGGQQPRWRRDGKELFFLSRDKKIMSVCVETGSTFQFSAAKALFQTQASEPIGAEEFFTYDVCENGQRFLVNVKTERDNPPPVDIILNWASRLEK